MKLKSLAVITLFVLGCSAAFAQQGSATLCFEDYNGTPACNYIQIQWNGWSLSGEEIESNCFGGANAQIIGSKVASLAGSGVPVQGLVYAYSDIIFDEQNPGEQWFVLTKTAPSTRLHQFGWAGYVGIDGYEFLGNYGYLYACTPDSAPVSNQRTYTAVQEALNQTKTIPK
jgi:hypothetical protein